MKSLVKFSKSTLALVAIVIAFGGAKVTWAQTTFTWIGNSLVNGDVTAPANWQGGTSPTGNGAITEDVTFGNLTGTQANPLLPVSGFILHSLTFNGTSRPAMTFSGTGNPTFGLTGNITVATAGSSGTVTFDNSFNVSLSSGAHTVTLTPAGSLMTVASSIAGSGSIVKSGAGLLKLNGANTFSGGVTLSSGGLSLGSSTALGTGGLTMNNGTSLFATGSISVGNAVTLATASVIINAAANGVDALELSGTISGSGNISKTGNGSLTLSSVNTFFGNLTLTGGDLFIRTNASLGNSANVLTLGLGTTFHPVGNLTVANSIALGGTATINIADLTSDSLTLNGTLSGSSQLNLTGDGVLSLIGNSSSWSGALGLNGNNAVKIYNNGALGSNPILLFDPASDSIVSFYVDATIKGLASLSDPSGLYIDDGKTLTINQPTNSTFAGTIQGSGSVGGSLVKSGSGVLTLTGYNGYTGSTTITGGTLVADGSADNTRQTGNGAATIGASGTLTLLNTSLNNSSTTVNGRLTGLGTLTHSTTVNSGGIIAPGVATGNRIGALYFDDLTLRGGGILEWNLQNPNGDIFSGPGNAYDLVSISNGAARLHIDSSVNPATPFTIRIISVNTPGSLGTTTGFTQRNYTWTVFDGGQNSIDFGSGTFNPNAFSLDLSAFSSDAGPGSFALVKNGNLLQLTFTPVPEPSTWAMLTVGVAGVAWLRRKRIGRAS